MSSHRRRQYPQQQYAAYEAPAANPAAPPVGGPAGYGYPTPGEEQGGGMFVPGGGAAPFAAPETDQLASAVGQMSVSGGSQASVPSGYPSYGSGYGTHAPAAAPYGGSNSGVATVPLNELYTVDLLQSLPPPVNDLDLPPPPLAVAPEMCKTMSEYANLATDYLRPTLNVFPKSNSQLKKSKLPLSVIMRPFNALHDEDENVPVVDDMSIARCRRCRAYINPFVKYLDQDYRWQCNICGLANDVPQSFDWNATDSIAKNRWERPELNYSVVEYIAPQEYLVRPPQPPTYVFLIDVSVNATASHMLEAAANTLRLALDKVPNKDGRTRVAFIGVDASLNYFQIPLVDPSLDTASETNENGGEKAAAELEPRLLVVGDLEEPFLPSNTGLLVNLQQNRQQIDRLLDMLPQLFAGSVISSNALGSGLKAALKLIGNVGGKIVCITSSLPTVGIGKLEQRDERKLLGTKNEHQLFAPANSFYRSFAVECNRAQVSVDMFLLSNSYQDVATLSNLPKFTSGSTFFYPGWNGLRPSDAGKFEHELTTHLSDEIGLEGMLRLRASSGVRSSAFTGHFFVRSSDLMTFPTLPREQGYVVDLTIDETITKPYVCLQGALLYTSATGERKIRVMTILVPTSDKLSDVYASADQQAIATWYAHQANEKTLSSGVTTSQDWLNARIAELLKTYRSDVLNTHTGTSGALSLPSNLTLLPLLVYALKKSIALRRTSAIMSDIRVNSLDLLLTLPLPHLMKYLYPEFYALHELPEEAGLPDENGTIVLPPRLNLTGEVMQGHGLYLLDDGQIMFVWLGRDVVPQLLLDAFGTQNIDEVPSGKAEMPVVEGSVLNEKIRNLISASRYRPDTVFYPTVYIIRESTEASLRLWATALLVEDRSESEPTYYQYLHTIREKLNA